MATIGTIKSTGNNAFEGTLAMISLKSRIRLEPNAFGKTDKAPTHRVLIPGGGEIGAAWTNTSEQSGETYLSLKLDAPEMREPVYCNTGPAAGTDPEEGLLSLIWNRKQ